jgi:glycosyltransferase involved in cell wall biosynthesis
MASPFLGGPERQALGVAKHTRGEMESVFLSFAERGSAQAFLDEARNHGFQSKSLVHNTPRFFACVQEVADELRRLRADLLCCSGYKPDLVGWRAARRVGVPVVSISHGWTSATWRVRGYEMLDKLALRWMDAIVCVSKAQADKVRAAGVPGAKVAIIENAIGEEAFVEPQRDTRAEMCGWFNQPPRWLIGAAGRLSPEKGFHVYVEAAALVLQQRPEAGFILFGDGPLRGKLEKLVAERRMKRHFILAGFRNDLCRLLPNLDINVISSFTEGLPVILLEAGAAGAPTVATSVGGIPEVIDEGQSGYLVSSGDSAALAKRVVDLLDNDTQRLAMGQAARERVRKDFSFVEGGRRYHELFQRLVGAYGIHD